MHPDRDFEIMLAYLLLKVRQQDWHGVADAAMDIREMQARGQGRSTDLRS